MILSLLKTKIWFYQNPIDFRKQSDGLVLLVSGHLHCDPVSGQLFVFRNRGADKLKLLYWDDNGFWLLYKRLEKGRFTFPKVIGQAMELTREQLSWLLSGLDFTQQKMLPRVNAKHFY